MKRIFRKAFMLTLFAAFLIAAMSCGMSPASAKSCGISPALATSCASGNMQCKNKPPALAIVTIPYIENFGSRAWMSKWSSNFDKEAAWTNDGFDGSKALQITGSRSSDMRASITTSGYLGLFAFDAVFNGDKSGERNFTITATSASGTVSWAITILVWSSCGKTMWGMSVGGQRIETYTIYQNPITLNSDTLVYKDFPELPPVISWNSVAIVFDGTAFMVSLGGTYLSINNTIFQFPCGTSDPVTTITISTPRGRSCASMIMDNVWAASIINTISSTDGLSGNGTARDPYVIDGVVGAIFPTFVNLPGFNGHLIIRNCELYQISSTSWWIPANAISFPALSINESVVIENDFFKNCFHAVDIGSGATERQGACTIKNCMFEGISSGGSGINANYLESVTIQSCQFLNLPIGFQLYGIGVGNVNNCLIRGNKFTNCSIAEGAGITDNYTIDTTNEVNGGKTVLLMGATGFDINGEYITMVGKTTKLGRIGQIMLGYCSNFTIRNQYFTGGSDMISIGLCDHGVVDHVLMKDVIFDGLFSAGTDHLIIRDLTVQLSGRSGILLGGDTNVLIDKCDISDCVRGIRLFLGDNITVSRTAIWYSKYFYDILDSSSNPEAEFIGLDVRNAGNVTVNGCTFLNCRDGITTGSFYGVTTLLIPTIEDTAITFLPGFGTGYWGISLTWPISGPVIKGCDISDYYYGILMSSYPIPGTIDDNFIHDNGVGIYSTSTAEASGNLIANNHLSPVFQQIGNCIGYGFYDVTLWNTGTISGNDFIGNNNGSVQAYSYPQSDGSYLVTWSGNYWSDYTARYPNATAINGTWSIPYRIDGGGFAYNYPYNYDYSTAVSSHGLANEFCEHAIDMIWSAYRNCHDSDLAYHLTQGWWASICSLLPLLR